MYFYEIGHSSWEYYGKYVLAHEVRYTHTEFVEIYTKALCQFVERWLSASEDDRLASTILVGPEDACSYLIDELCANYGFRQLTLQATLVVDDRSQLHPSICWPGDVPTPVHSGTDVNAAFRRALDNYAERISERNKLIYDKFNTEG